MAMTPPPSEVPGEEVSAPDVLAARPKVSILTITFNHARFVAECIESALGQQADFSFEMVIGEDCSEDGTRQICLDYQRKYPGRIRLLLPERNIGSYENFRRVFAACRGEYIALLEGDDYWTSPMKLQRQADLLVRNPGWALCFHDVMIVTDGDRSPPRPFCSGTMKPVYAQRDLIERNFVPTCSCMFRNRGGAGLPPWYYDRAKNPYPDWVLHACNARHGDLGYLDERWGVHRRHAGGVWGSTFNGTVEGDIERMRKRQVAFQSLEECMGASYGAAFRRQRALNAYHLSLAYREKGDWPAVRRCLWQAFRADPFARIPFLRSGLIAAMQGLRK